MIQGSESGAAGQPEVPPPGGGQKERIGVGSASITASPIVPGAKVGSGSGRPAKSATLPYQESSMSRSRQDERSSLNGCTRRTPLGVVPGPDQAVGLSCRRPDQRTS